MCPWVRGGCAEHEQENASHIEVRDGRGPMALLHGGDVERGVGRRVAAFGGILACGQVLALWVCISSSTADLKYCYTFPKSSVQSHMISTRNYWIQSTGDRVVHCERLGWQPFTGIWVPSFFLTRWLPLDMGVS